MLDQHQREPYLLNVPYCHTVTGKETIINKLLMFLIQHFLEQLSTINCPENYVKSKLYTNKCSLLCN